MGCFQLVVKVSTIPKWYYLVGPNKILYEREMDRQTKYNKFGIFHFMVRENDILKGANK